MAHRDFNPRVVVLAGPNGAGKTTSADEILRGPLVVGEFVNADLIARGLSGISEAQAPITAGRMMLVRLRELAARRQSFGFETTLASRSFAPWLSRLLVDGYEFHLVFLWLPTPETAIARVVERVRRGGHDVAEAIIRRRYHAGLKNLFDIYLPLATNWQVIHNGSHTPRLIAEGRALVERVCDATTWATIKKSAGYEERSER